MILAQSLAAQAVAGLAAWMADGALPREATIGGLVAASAAILVAAHFRLKPRIEKRMAARIAAQVSHDIRSPLAALEMIAAGEGDGLAEEKRIMVRSAVGRIRDIANDLLRKNGERAGDRRGGPSVELLSCLVETLLTEKRMQYRAKLGFEIESRLDAASYGLFSRVDASELMRELSDLIDLAVEAGASRGRVELRMRTESDRHVIELVDHQGASRGTMRLEIARAPAWFVPELELRGGQPVVVLDDDASTHQIWESRLGGVELLRFSTGRDLARWAEANPALKAEALYLCDYELLGEKENGLDVIERLGIAPRSVLVTSRFAETQVRERSERLGIRLIPKSIAGYVPIRLREATQAVDAVLIDDDALIRSVWSADAKRKGLRFQAFSSASEFLESCAAFDREARVFVDSNLGSGVRGEEVAREIHALGFENVHLATGYEPESFPSMPWIKSIVGKEPAW
jgi:hypothetical protein